MKRLTTILALATMVMFLGIGTAFASYTPASSVLPGTSGYSWTSMAYWTPTDLTTGEDGSAFFEIKVENANYESDFGLYTVDNVEAPTLITDSFQIFGKKKEPYEKRTVSFKNEGDGWQITKSNIIGWKPFDNVFGFYYGVHTGGATDTTVDYTFYSDPYFNTINQGTPHVAMEWSGSTSNNVYIYLEDLPNGTADWDWQDMTVFGNDLAPVPIPGTLMLLGSGLLGLAGLRRKFSKK